MDALAAVDPDPPIGRGWRSTTSIAVASGTLLLATLVADLAVGDRAALTVFFGLAPLLAASALTPLSTAGFAVAAVVCAAVSGWWNHGGVQYWIRLTDVALVGALAVLVATVRVRRETDLRTSRRIAGVAQQALLPVLPPSIGHAGFATRYHSATSSAQIGGDFFDFVADRGRIRLILGDVSGKGIDAVTQAARVIRAFRQYGASEPDLLSVARRIDEYVTPFWGWEFYATAVLIEITDAQKLRIVSAGHPPPLHRSAEGVRELAIEPSVPLGLGPAQYLAEHAWRAGDRVLLYTDGLIEARNESGAFLPAERIEAALGEADANGVLDTLLRIVHTHSGRFDDDLALLLVTHSPEGTQEPASAQP